MKNLSVSFVTMGLLLSLSSVSCQKKHDDSPPPAPAPAGPPPPPPVTLDNLSPAGCLNLPLYFSKLNQLDHALPVLEVTTHFKMTSKKQVRRNFEKMLAYGSFRIAKKTLDQIPEIRPAEQNVCESVTFTSPGGTDEVYKVTESSKTQIHAVKENGDRLQIHFLTPQSMEILTTYTAFDAPCEKDNPATVELTRVIDWTQVALETIDPKTSALAIDPHYLGLVAEATGTNPNELYSQVTPVSEPTTPDPVNPEIPVQPVMSQDAQILVAKVTEMMQKPPLTEVVACRPLDSQPPPPPTPDPDDHGHDNSGDGVPGTQPNPNPGGDPDPGGDTNPGGNP